MNRIFERNEAGRDFIVGDTHGAFSRLFAALQEFGFDALRDRLFIAGDLGDRGPESHMVQEILGLPWVHAVRGNHEELAISHYEGRGNEKNYVKHGGAWFVSMPVGQQKAIVELYRNLPIAITLNTAAGRVGIVHAGCPLPSWDEFNRKLAGVDSEAFIDYAMWSRAEDRERIDFDGFVSDVRAVVVGHTIVKKITTIGNHIQIDTAGFHRDGYFTIIDADTLEPARKTAR